MTTNATPGGVAGLDPADEAAIVAAASTGDREAFAALYDRYFDAIYAFVRRMVRNTGDAEEIVSETWLKATERLGTLKDPAAFRGWLYSIARNTALNLIERRGREVPLPEDADPSAPAAAGPEGSAEMSDLLSNVMSAARTFLGDRDAYVLDLVVNKDFSSAEVAQVLDVKPSHAYVLVNRLKDRLRDALGASVLLQLARAGRRACPELSAIARDPDEADVGARVRAHLRRCEDCKAGHKRYAAMAIPLLAHGAALAGAHLPPTGLKERVWDGCAEAMGEGWPVRPARPRRVRRLASAAGMTLVLVAGAVFGPAQPTARDDVSAQPASVLVPATTPTPTPSASPSPESAEPTATPRERISGPSQTPRPTAIVRTAPPPRTLPPNWTPPPWPFPQPEPTPGRTPANRTAPPDRTASPERTPPPTEPSKQTPPPTEPTNPR